MPQDWELNSRKPPQEICDECCSHVDRQFPRRSCRRLRLLRRRKSRSRLQSLPPLPLAHLYVPSNGDRYTALGHLFADVLDRASEIYYGQKCKPAQLSDSDYRSGDGTAGNRTHLRRRQRRSHPAWRSVHQADPIAVPPRHARQTHYAPGEERKRRGQVRHH